jgi:hypothetical protein
MACAAPYSGSINMALASGLSARAMSSLTSVICAAGTLLGSLGFSILRMEPRWSSAAMVKIPPSVEIWRRPRSLPIVSV